MEKRFGKSNIGKNLIVGIVFLIITVSFYFYLFWNYDPVYGINDDWTLYMVISGSYLGYPEPHVNYMMYPLAWLLCQLYKITSEIPWYGIMLQGCMALCGASLFFRIYFKIKRRYIGLFYAIITLVIFYASHIGIFLLIQYTHVGGICGATAIFLFLTSDTKEKDWKGYLRANIPAIILAAVSMNIRQNTLYMCLPAGGMIFIAKYFLEDRKLGWKAVRKYSGFILAAFISLGGTFLIHQIAYSSEEWKEYVEINDTWTNGVDYYGFPTYEEVEKIVTENGMTKEDYEISISFQTYYKGKMPYADYLGIITEIAKEKYNEKHTFDVKFENANREIVDSFVYDTMKPQNTIVILFYLFLLLQIILHKDFKAILSMGCYLFGRFFAWYYLLFAGRFPLRIAQVLLTVDFMVIIGILLYFHLYEWKTEWNKKAGIIVRSIFITACVFFVSRGIEVLEEQISYVDIFQDRWYGIKKYCKEHQENRYFLSGGSQTLHYFSDEIFETDSIGKPQNFYTNNNFDSPSPNFYNMLGLEFGTYVGADILEQEENYWLYEKGTFSEEVDAVKYYKSQYNTFEYELVDTFETETSSFEVYQFRK